MLEFLREKAGSWVIKIVLFFIAAVFAFMGVDIMSAPKKRSVATVNGDEILIEEFQTVYNGQINRLKTQFGGQINDDMLKMLKIKQNTFDSLVSRKLLLQKSEECGIRISDEELSAAIAETFKTPDGKFSSDVYRQTLAQNGLSTGDYERDQREMMALKRLQEIIMSGVKVTDLELKEWYLWENAEANVFYASFDPASFRDIEIKNEELSAFFEKHKDKYKTPEKMQIRYIKIRTDDYKTRVSVSGQEINDYYTDNIDDFKAEQKARARHILISIDKNADNAKIGEARLKAEKILAEAKAGKDFIRLADEYTEEPSGKGKGGDLGEFDKNSMEKSFSDAVFALEPGEIAGPVKTESGWHIIKLESVTPEFKSLEDVREEIKNKIVGEKYRQLAYTDIESVYEATLKGDTLEQAAKAVNGLKVELSGFFTRDGDEDLKDIFVDSSNIVNVAFDLNPGSISDIVENNGELVIVEAAKKQEAMAVTLEQAKDMVSADFLKQRQNEIAKAKAEAFLAAAAKGGDFKTLADEYKASVSETGYFKRDGILPGEFGYAPEITKAAFELSAKKILPSNILSVKDHYYVIRFKDKKYPDITGFDQDRPALEAKILKTKQDDFFSSCLAELKKNGKVEILHPEILEQ